VTEVDLASPSGIFVAHITPGSPADLSGRVRVGDEILAVDGVNVQRMTHAECLAQVIAPSVKQMGLTCRKDEIDCVEQMRSCNGTLDLTDR
jgi:C-terminal processing protease CtpA/Prc